jgi:arginine deiminase
VARTNRSDTHEAARSGSAATARTHRYSGTRLLIPFVTNQAGFDNSGESLTISPALMSKYLEAARQVVNMLFEKNIVKKITVIKIPRRRDYMHIDTIFTQVKRNVWVMLGAFSKKVMKHEGADPIERILEGKSKEIRQE